MFDPLGFTPIAFDYSPLDPPPDISGLKDNTTPLLIDGQVAIPGYTVSTEDATIQPVAGQWTLTLRVTSPFVRPADTFELQCEVQSLYAVPAEGTVLLRVLSGTADLPATAYTASLNNNSCTFTGVMGVNTAVGSTLQLVAHLAEDSSPRPLGITNDEYSALQNRSNLATLFVISGNNTTEPPTPPAIAAIPLHDVIASTLGTTLHSYIIEERLDLSPTNTALPGSSGPGVYKDLGLSSPASASMHAKVPSQSLQRILGMTIDELKRLEGWITNILHKVHSTRGQPNSELNLLLDLLPPEIRDAVDRYKDLIDEAGKLASDVASTFVPDYAHGNTVVKSNAVMQHNAHQYRVQTSSVLDFNSPSVNISAQQTLHQSRFEHHAGDLYQGSHIHYFLRAEDNLTLMGQNTTRYSGELVDYSANSTVASGNTLRYADTEWDQVGQTYDSPLHPSRSRSAFDYGRAVKLVQRDYHVLTIEGSMVVNSFKDLDLVSKISDVKLRANTGSVHLTAPKQNIVADAGSQLILHGYSNTQLSSSGMLQVSAASPVVIRGSIVYLNCSGKGRTMSPFQPVARTLTYEPQIMKPLTDPAPYVKQTPVAPGPVGQEGINTPEPNQTPGGPEALGQYLTGAGANYRFDDSVKVGGTP